MTLQDYASRGRGIEEGGKGGCQEGSRMAADGTELPRGVVPANGAVPELQDKLGKGNGRPCYAFHHSVPPWAIVDVLDLLRVRAT